jgi:hypothetical protein
MSDYTMTFHKTCQEWRRILVYTSTPEGQSSQAWVTRTCDLPLQEDEEKRRGRCRSCISGWTHPESYPVAAPTDDTLGVKCRYCGKPADGEVIVRRSVAAWREMRRSEDIPLVGVCSECREGRR